MKPAQWLEVLRYLSLITGIGVTFCAAVLLGWRLGSALGGLWVVPAPGGDRRRRADGVFPAQKISARGVSSVDEVAVLQRRLISQAAAASSVLAGLALLSGRRPEAWGVLLGTVVAIFNFSLLARSIRNLIGADPRSARLKGGLGYIGRYLLTAAALFIHIHLPISIFTLCWSAR